MNIKNIRLKKGFDQTEFAKIIGVSKTTISDWENNKSSPRPNHIKKILQFCKDNNIEV